MVQVAFLGLGNMGSGMANNLITKGNLEKPAIVWNRSAKKAEPFKEKNCVVVSSSEEAIAKSDIIFSCISNDEAVKSLFDTAFKVPGGVKGKTFVECSTIHPDTTRELEKLTKEAGAEFVASPVFGVPAVSAAGGLIFVLAGSKTGIEQIRPYIVGVMGRMIIDLSDKPDIGKALDLKISGNSIIIAMVEALAEGHVLAEKCGLGTEYLDQFINGLFGASPFSLYSKRLLTGDYLREEPIFAVDLAAKDARHAVSLAKSSGTEMPIAEIALQHFAEVKKVQGESGDLTSIYGVLREKAGLPYSCKK
ncbi:hypothetical protein V1511DRAFT_360994 [Dipodascopsis uninucleata]